MRSSLAKVAYQSGIEAVKIRDYYTGGRSSRCHSYVTARQPPLLQVADILLRIERTLAH